MYRYQQQKREESLASDIPAEAVQSATEAEASVVGVSSAVEIAPTVAFAQESEATSVSASAGLPAVQSAEAGASSVRGVSSITMMVFVLLTML